MTTTVDDRLLELLNHKDEALAQAHARIEQLEREVDSGLDWMRQERLDKAAAEADPLPVPRVQLQLVSNDNWAQEWAILMVSARPWGGQVRVPLDMSKRSGGEFPLEVFPLEGAVPPHLSQQLPNLTVDAGMYATSLGMPLAVVLDDERRYVAQRAERGWTLQATPPRG